MTPSPPLRRARWPRSSSRPASSTNAVSESRPVRRSRLTREAGTGGRAVLARTRAASSTPETVGGTQSSAPSSSPVSTSSLVAAREQQHRDGAAGTRLAQPPQQVEPVGAVAAHGGDHDVGAQPREGGDRVLVGTAGPRRRSRSPAGRSAPRRRRGCRRRAGRSRCSRSRSRPGWRVVVRSRLSLGLLWQGGHDERSGRWSRRGPQRARSCGGDRGGRLVLCRGRMHVDHPGGHPLRTRGAGLGHHGVRQPEAVRPRPGPVLHREIRRTRHRRRERTTLPAVLRGRRIDHGGLGRVARHVAATTCAHV